MAIFGRKERADPRPAIEQFWAWWKVHRADVLDAADAHDAERVVSLLQPAVSAIHPGLEWELAKGERALRALIVAGRVGPQLRGLAERWYQASPDPDSDVECSPIRRRDARVLQSTLTVDDYELPMNELVAGTRVDAQRQRLDIVVHHPIFPLLDNESEPDIEWRRVQHLLG